VTPERRKPKGIRRVERWLVGIVMTVVAFVLEKAVMRAIKRDGGKPPDGPAPTTIRAKGPDAAVD
jgi:hypothetical protein